MKIYELTQDQLKQVKLKYFVDLGGLLNYTNYENINKLVKDDEIFKHYGESEIDYKSILRELDQVDLTALNNELDQIIDQQKNGKSLNLNADEKQLADRIINKLAAEYQGYNFEVVRKSESYATIVIKKWHNNGADLDIVKFKYTPKAKWLGVLVAPGTKETALFNNTKQSIWKGNIKAIEDTDEFFNYLKDGIKAAENYK